MALLTILLALTCSDARAGLLGRCARALRARFGGAALSMALGQDQVLATPLKPAAQTLRLLSIHPKARILIDRLAGRLPRADELNGLLDSAIRAPRDFSNAVWPVPAIYGRVARTLKERLLIFERALDSPQGRNLDEDSALLAFGNYLFRDFDPEVNRLSLARVFPSEEVYRTLWEWGSANAAATAAAESWKTNETSGSTDVADGTVVDLPFLASEDPRAEFKMLWAGRNPSEDPVVNSHWNKLRRRVAILIELGIPQDWDSWQDRDPIGQLAEGPARISDPRLNLLCDALDSASYSFFALVTSRDTLSPADRDYLSAVGRVLAWYASQLRGIKRVFFGVLAAPAVKYQTNRRILRGIDLLHPR